MSNRIKADLFCNALKSAYCRQKPLPGSQVHSDRGSQYDSDRYRQSRLDSAMQQAISRKANCWDNSPMEFLQIAEGRAGHQLSFETRDEARLDIINLIESF